MTRGLLAALVALGLWAGAAGAEPVRLSAEEMRNFGEAALVRGFADQALSIAETLLQRDPGDALALILKAQAHRMRGELEESEAAARAAWATAESAAERYGAATALAQALSLQDQRTRAQYWLRQAVQHAPTPGARAQAVEDYNYVRDQNPVSLQLNGMVRPSDNVNGGGKVAFIQVGPFVLPLPSTLLALSGTSWAFGVDGQLRLAEDERSRTALTFGANLQGAVLSDAARTLAPDVANGDFLYGQVQLGLQRRIDLSFGRLTADLGLGHSWYGGADLADNLTAQLTLDRRLDDDLALQLGANLTRQWRLDDGEASSTTLSGEATLTRRLASGDALAVTLDLSQVQSAQPGTERREAGLALRWQAGKPVAGLDLGASLSLGYALYGNEREDIRHAAGLQATLGQVSYLGFSPVISLDVSHNSSSVPWFTTDTVALGLSLTSRF